MLLVGLVESLAVITDSDFDSRTSGFNADMYRPAKTDCIQGIGQ